MAASKSDLPDRQKQVRPPAIIKLTLAVGGTGGVAGAVGLALAGHVPFSQQAGVFEDIVAVIALIALLAVALIALTVSLDHLATSRLRYRVGKRAVDTAKSHDEALKTYRTLHSSVSRSLRSLLGHSDGHDEDGGGEGT
jgi:NhaP-type Na+/H+ or K+/H+ antiporter